ncbi:hypothetical protein [Nocardia gamkensis]|uniref:hypothetical protein n=1 Tax=Nocardia gamkensis TaxID=352869 RepID=UPI0037CC0C07
MTLQNAGAPEHRSYNIWHQLDHRPENLALPGVAWGDRWSRPEEFRTGPVIDEHAGTDYVAMYWFRDPFEESVRQWNDLGADSFEWGRGPLIPGVHRSLLGFFRPVKGYVAASALVSADVLPYRPNQGLHLTLTRYAEARSDDTHEHHRWEDRSLIPQLLSLDGVAGVWTFSFDHHQHVTMRPRDARGDSVGSMRIRLVYLDGEPLETVARIHDAQTSAARDLPSSAAAGARCLMSTALRTIVPFRDW